MDVIFDQIEFTIAIVAKNVSIVYSYISEAISDVFATLFGKSKPTRTKNV